jgi:hypothetical protein
LAAGNAFSHPVSNRLDCAYMAQSSRNICILSVRVSCAKAATLGLQENLVSSGAFPDPVLHGWLEQPDGLLSIH